MEYRTLGKTGLRVSALGFGCGNVGGLMIRGAPAERERAVARAIELGINYFDTAPAYGDGVSERHLGQALRALGASVVVGTKFRVEPHERTDVAGAVTRSLEASLGRLGMERVDLFQLHNPIGGPGRGGSGGETGTDTTLEAIVPALERLRQQGKVRFYGITALGDTAALHRVLDAGRLDTAQVCYNLLNPSAGVAVPAGFPGQDFGRLLDRARGQRVGVIVIRVLAAGALSGSPARHPVAVPSVEPIASGPDYATDVARARGLEPLVREGHAASLVEAALRFPLGSDAVSTVMLGYSDLAQLEGAAAAMAKGPLPPAALERLGALWRGLGGG
jgi:aryl-alcohol dehydrogenase-like predicted oxidoreductase